MGVFSGGSLNDDMEHLGVWEGFSARGGRGRKNIAEEGGGKEMRVFMVWGFLFLFFSSLYLEWITGKIKK